MAVQYARLPAWLAELVTRFLPVGLGLGAAVWWTMRCNRLTLATTLGLCRTQTVGSLLLLVLSVMVFQHMLSCTKAASQIAAELQALQVPLILVVALLPFVAGAVTGLAVGVVGTSFPIVLPLMALLRLAGI